MQAPSAPLLRLVSISKKYGSHWALYPLNLEIHEGEFLTILGPNGAGKTTLLRIISGLTPPSEGRLEYRPGTEPGQIREQVGYVSHQSLLYQEMTGRENLLFYGRLYELQDLGSRTQQCLAELGLGGAGDQIVRTYSRGMKQRLTLARALLHDPRLLLLDEPYAGLDPQGCKLLTRILRRFREGGRTILLITHNLREGLELAHRVVILHRGEMKKILQGAELDLSRLEETYLELVRGEEDESLLETSLPGGGG